MSEMERLIIDSTEKINGEWVAYAHDREGIYLLREYDGTGNIRIEYAEAQEAQKIIQLFSKMALTTYTRFDMISAWNKTAHRGGKRGRK